MAQYRRPTPTILPPVPMRILLEFAGQERQARTTGTAGDPTHELMARKLEGAIETHSPAPAGARVLIGGTRDRLEEDAGGELVSGLARLEAAGIRPRHIVTAINRGAADTACAIASRARISRTCAPPEGHELLLMMSEALAWITREPESMATLRAAHASGDWIIWEPRAAFTSINGDTYRTFVGVRKALLEGGEL